ncbi:pentatricopeptide repeat-containing protein At3g18110, chloroplastic isoform X1 [Amborella trichopoda]|uniref:PROP1-like PPR domain-containing protein n=2 Tax=Amborella trichopoda TaxID=13333 RepID=W1NH35_AMBTC|nr:pentatricopeptide repeat-containing protein At3g18110, chloroplastic isoform X1 [Amborella trichopoda]ERM94798.1 hypothetical protein AMTR_s00011p00265800 [Amborella trichopoda]|eukprot:XP_006878653.1 pentatricopeptide repeat-containing protein At3g18110, chloroplastic isoform X1 [Amborella trichopoda]
MVRLQSSSSSSSFVTLHSPNACLSSKVLLLPVTTTTFKFYFIPLNNPKSLRTLSVKASVEKAQVQEFRYSRASPSVRWPNLKFTEKTLNSLVSRETLDFLVSEKSMGDGLITEKKVEDYLDSENRVSNSLVSEETMQSALVSEESMEDSRFSENTREESDSERTIGPYAETLRSDRRTRAKKLSKLALKRAKDWRQRVQSLTDEILKLQPSEFVADVLDANKIQLSPTDYCFVVKWVGHSNWQRALEIYEWLNLRHWYTPSARMLATILAVLGKANQETLAEAIFSRAKPEIGNVVQVYNSMMGVYARQGRFDDAQELLKLMRRRGCEPDLVSFNTLINARAKARFLSPGSAMDILNEIRKSGLRPDIITYNTLISSCASGSSSEEAVRVFQDMEHHGCLPDLWTYNAMISVFGRSGNLEEVENIYNELGRKGFFPDAVTFNSLLYAYAKNRNLEKVKWICEEMVRAGFKLDEIAYNTLIHMYGKMGKHELGFQLYEEMKLAGCTPDSVTFTVLIDSLGKAGQVKEAADVLSEMLDARVRPTLRTYSALICGYAKAGMRDEAGETFDWMVKSGIKPDHLAYSVMLDVLIRANDTRKVMGLYQRMVRDGLRPDQSLYETMLQVFVKDSKHEEVEILIKDIKKSMDIGLPGLCSVLVRAECFEDAVNNLRLAVTQGFVPESDIVSPILSWFSSLGRHEEARSLINFLKEHAPKSSASSVLVHESLLLMLCNAHQTEAAMEEYYKMNFSGGDYFSSSAYETLILCCEEAELFAEASQLYSDMNFYCFGPTPISFKCAAMAYSKMGFPETAHHVIQRAEKTGVLIDDLSLYVTLIESYGKLKLWQRAESVVGTLRLYTTVDRRVWNALINAYATSGKYEQARAVFNNMVRDGPFPTVESINGLMEALINSGRLDELYVVIQELQEMGFKISKSTILLMLDAFARAGNIFEVKKIYHGMKAAGYLPTMHLYRNMVGLFSRGKRVRDVELMVAEMEEAGFKCDLFILNCMLRMYTGIEDFRKTVDVYRKIQEMGFEPDEDTYNILIIMYSKDLRAEEAFSLLNEMRREGLDPKLGSYKSLLSSCGKQELWEEAEVLFKEMVSKGFKLDRGVYHSLLKIYRNCGSHEKAENLLVKMKDDGIEPSLATMHLLMDSYGQAGLPDGAENVLKGIKSSGLNVGTVPYVSVIDVYLKNGEYELGIEKMLQMKRDGVDPDYRVWTCFIRAASRCRQRNEALKLLNCLSDVGFDLPLRLLMGKSELLILEMDHLLEQLGSLEEDAAFRFVNALEDLLWAFERRAAASWVFQMAIQKNIYPHDVFRVAEKNWGADFRKLSGGAALVGLTLWLDHMQDASLQGLPESPKSVVLITGTAEYNNVSISKTLKAFLWEMGSPFLPSKTRTGILVAKAHSLRMWLKDSAFCMDLELRDASSLPELNSMQLNEGYFMRSGLVPVFKEIQERLGDVRPKTFARLALLCEEKRERVITADIKGRKEKLEKMKRQGRMLRSQRRMKFRKRRFFKSRATFSEQAIAK